MSQASVNGFLFIFDIYRPCFHQNKCQ